MRQPEKKSHVSSNRYTLKENTATFAIFSLCLSASSCLLLGFCVVMSLCFTRSPSRAGFLSIKHSLARTSPTLTTFVGKQWALLYASAPSLPFHTHSVFSPLFVSLLPLSFALPPGLCLCCSDAYRCREQAPEPAAAMPEWHGSSATLRVGALPAPAQHSTPSQRDPRCESRSTAAQYACAPPTRTMRRCVRHQPKPRRRKTRGERAQREG